jgi:hypothetical protein
VYKVAPLLQASEKFMFTQFRDRYPNGSLVTELSAIDHGKYIVRCLVQVGGTTLVTALAAAETVELAEDQARSRVLAILGIDSTTTPEEEETSLVATEAPTSVVTPNNSTSTAFSVDPGVAPATLTASLGQTQPTLFPEAVRTSETNSLSVSEQNNDDIAAPTATRSLLVDEVPFTEEFPSPEVETFHEIDTGLIKAEKMSSTPLNSPPVTSYSQSELETATSAMPATSTPIDFSDIIARTNVELKRLGWTNQQGRDYLVQTYGKRSRQLLTDDELLDFLHHLESEPSPD